MSFASEFGCSWGYSSTTSRRGMSNAVAQWLSAIDMLPAVAERLKRAQIGGTWFDVIQAYDGPSTFFYIDPPFVLRMRRSGRYWHEMSDSEHEILVEELLRIRGEAVLSGYNNPIYEALEHTGWRRVDLTTACSAAGPTRSTGLLGADALANSSQTYAYGVGVAPHRRNRIWPPRPHLTTRRASYDFRSDSNPIPTVDLQAFGTSRSLLSTAKAGSGMPSAL